MGIAELLKPKPLEIESCPDVCARAEWYRDPVMSEIHGDERGQFNCPYHFGVDHQAAIIDGEVLCKHLKRKEDAWASRKSWHG